MTNPPLPYEFHVTVEADKTKPRDFIRACRELGVKAIVLDLGVNACVDLTDYMTSSKGMLPSDEAAFEELERIAGGLRGDGFSVIRRKIETAPWHPYAPQAIGEEMPAGCYFESHLAVGCKPEEVPTLRDGILESSDELPLHLSRNQFKPPDELGNIIMMATLREHDHSFEAFSNVIDASRMRIANLGFDLTKPPITEFSMHDSNVHQDNAWMAR